MVGKLSQEKSSTKTYITLPVQHQTADTVTDQLFNSEDHQASEKIFSGVGVDQNKGPKKSNYWINNNGKKLHYKMLLKRFQIWLIYSLRYTHTSMAAGLHAKCAGLTMRQWLVDSKCASTHKGFTDISSMLHVMASLHANISSCAKIKNVKKSITSSILSCVQTMLNKFLKNCAILLIFRKQPIY